MNMLSRDFNVRSLYAPFALIGRCSPCFLLMTLTLLAVTFLPGVLLFALLFLWVPALWVLYAKVYYHWSLAETWGRVRRHARPILILLAFYALPVVLLTVLIQMDSLLSYRALMYPGAGSAVHNLWLRFCDNFPLVLGLIIVGFFLFWPAISAIMFLEEKVTVMNMVMWTSEMLERMTFRVWLSMGIIVGGSYWFWVSVMPSLFRSWESLAMVIVLTILTVLFSGWAFIYGLTLDKDAGAFDELN